MILNLLNAGCKVYVLSVNTGGSLAGDVVVSVQGEGGEGESSCFWWGGGRGGAGGVQSWHWGKGSLTWGDILRFSCW